MDVKNDCVVEEVIPSKIKKMKQARLSFSKLPPKPLLDNVSSKKRKLESPKETKTPKIIKIAAKENSVEDIEEIDNVINETKTSSSSKTNIQVIDIESEEEETLDKSQRSGKKRRNKSKLKRSMFSKTKQTEPSSPNTSLIKFLIRTNKKDDKNISIDDNTTEKTERSNVSSSQNSNENSDIDSNVLDDDELEITADDTEKSNNTELLQTDKSLCIDSDSEINSSSDDENNTTKESEKKETEDLNIKTLGTTTPNTKKVDITKSKTVTPKQLKKEESAKKRKEKEELQLEKKKKRVEERENRRKEKEKKRKEKEEKERIEREQKKKEKEEKELKKQIEIEQKQKEKEAKEQERRKKEEEKKRKEEEKLECERKKQKAASTFASFFVPKKQEIKSTEEENTNVQTFMPFEIKADMRIAPICRGSLDKNKKLSLDDKLNKGHTETSNLYLAEMKDKRIIRHKSAKTWPIEAKNADVIILDEEENDNNSDVVFQPEIDAEKTRPKLLQFHENRRPPYWGTWRKESANINPRRPFSKDSKWFDYEVDSDEEWEEEEPGESLHGSEDEKDEENPDDDEYDVDNEFMVPHGYLSDEEARPDEEEDSTSMTPETQKFKLKLLGEQFEAERTAKMSKLKPMIIGCIWLGANNEYPKNTPKKVVEFLTARHAWVAQIPVVLPSCIKENADSDGTPLGTPSGSTRKKKVPTEALPDLIRLIHGNMQGKKFLIKEFLTFWNKQTASKDNQISKVSLEKKIAEIGKWIPCPDEGPMHLKSCWYVSEDFRRKFLSEEEKLVLPNSWKYNLTPKHKREKSMNNDDKIEKLEKDTDKDKKKVPLITQFTTKISQKEMQRQLETEPKQFVTPKPILQRPPKRAVLISIPKNDKKIPVINIEESVSKEDSKKDSKEDSKDK